MRLHSCSYPREMKSVAQPDQRMFIPRLRQKETNRSVAQ